MSTTRRGFLSGCSAIVAAYAGTSFNTLAFGDSRAPDNEEILITVFLRGGIDGLNVIPVISGPDREFYEAARPDIAIPVTGEDSALPLSAPFGIHRAADSWPSGTPVPPATLYELFQGGKLSVVVAAGMHEDNRSHFDSMGFMELGTPGQLTTADGWMTRHLQTATNIPDEILMPALAVGNLEQDVFRGSNQVINMEDPGEFSLAIGPSQWRDAQRVALRSLYGGSSWLHQGGSQALDAIDLIELSGGGEDNDPQNGAQYPNGSFGDHLQVIANMIKLDLGLRTATLDFGGWDTHNGQGDDGGGFFFNHFEELARGMAAFYTDLDGSGANNYTDRLTMVVMSEFGRRLVQNADKGTDHGHGNMMLVLSGNAIGGVHGPVAGARQRTAL